MTRPRLLAALAARLDPLADLVAALHAALVDQPPQTVREGGMIRDGFDPKLDELRSLAGDSKSWIAALRQRMADATGIVTLKVGFTRVFGYYLEVPKAHAAKVPADWIRKQTVAGAERYVTPELKEKEEVVLHAEDRARELEFELFETLRQAVADHARRIQATARALAEIDALHGLAAIAAANRYCRPVFVAENIPRDDAGNPLHPLHPCMLLEIRDGRHPVLETLRLDPPFVPNDTDLSGEACQIALITGPNMAGKSTYIRQVALIALMAHMGGFVPASACRLGPLDRIFTRVGAMDQLARGQSTFLVEMSETANILNNATDRSLVILDEIGRGTSTYDGLSIAWAVVEYLHQTAGRRPLALFATHYHELTALEGPLPRVRNLHVAVAEEDGRLAFLYRILRGGTDRSYGIHAAQVAGLPRRAVDRARRILADLEAGRAIHVGRAAGKSGGGAGSSPPEPPVSVLERTVQLTMFDAAPDPVRERLRRTDVNGLTPMQALSLLADLAAEARKP